MLSYLLLHIGEFWGIFSAAFYGRKYSAEKTPFFCRVWVYFLPIHLLTHLYAAIGCLWTFRSWSALYQVFAHSVQSTFEKYCHWPISGVHCWLAAVSTHPSRLLLALTSVRDFLAVANEQRTPSIGRSSWKGDACFFKLQDIAGQQIRRWVYTEKRSREYYAMQHIFCSVFHYTHLLLA